MHDTGGNRVLLTIAVVTIMGFLMYVIGSFMDRHPCPRQIMGYNCKGENCDHSDKAVAEAEWEMNRQ